jgi:hypothetical protein
VESEVQVNAAALLRAVDALVGMYSATRRLTGKPPQPPPDVALASRETAGDEGIGGQIEARLTNVVVAALKEAFDRDYARLELEREQIEAQRKRAEEALRLEVRRQAVEREVGRLRLLGGAAMVGWLASLLLLGMRVGGASTPARIALGAGSLLLLCALGSAFHAMGRVGRDTTGDAVASAPALPMWLLLAGLALTALSLLV